VDRAEVAAILKAKPDLVLHELQDELERRSGIRISHTQMWRAVRELGLQLKKSRSTPANGTRKRTKQISDRIGPLKYQMIS
jgi:transposase